MRRISSTELFVASMIFSRASPATWAMDTPSSTPFLLVSMDLTADSVPSRILVTSSATSRAPCWDCSASFRTSSATTANPRPASPALAASMAAFRASRLVWSARDVMVVPTTPIRAEQVLSSVMSFSVSATAFRMFSMCPMDWATVSFPLAAADAIWREFWSALDASSFAERMMVFISWTIFDASPAPLRPLFTSSARRVLLSATSLVVLVTSSQEAAVVSERAERAAAFCWMSLTTFLRLSSIPSRAPPTAASSSEPFREVRTVRSPSLPAREVRRMVSTARRIARMVVKARARAARATARTTAKTVMFALSMRERFSAALFSAPMSRISPISLMFPLTFWKRASSISAADPGAVFPDRRSSICFSDAASHLGNSAFRAANFWKTDSLPSFCRKDSHPFRFPARSFSASSSRSRTWATFSLKSPADLSNSGPGPRLRRVCLATSAW